MQKSKKYLLIIIASLIAFGSIAYQNIDVLLSNPLTIHLEAESISRISVDPAGNRFIIFNSSKRVAKIKPNGGIEYILNGDSAAKNRFYRAWDLTNDSNGNLYLLDYDTDDSGFKIVSENIKVFDPAGGYIKTVFTHSYEETDQPDMEGNYRKIRYENGSILYYFDDPENLVIGRIDTETGKNSILKSIPMENPKLNIVDCDFSSDLSSVAYVTKKGKIFLSEKNSAFREIYSSSQPAIKNTISIPWQITLDGTSIYFSDAGLKKIVKIRKNTYGRLEFSFSGVLPEIIRSFRIIDDTFIAVTDTTLSSGDFRGYVKSDSDKKRYSTLIIAARWGIMLCGIIFCAGVLSLVIWTYVYVFRRKLSEVTVQSMMIIGVVVIATVLVLKITIPSFTGIQKTSVLNNLKHLNQLSSKYIDGNIVSRITDRDDFMNNDYVKVRSQLHGMFNNNGDEWNADYYGGIYTMKNNNIYVLMFFDDSSGVNFPYKEDYMQTPFKEVIENGNIVTIEENDIYGSWIYSLGPIYNSKGELVGILEVGKDLSSFQGKIRDFISKINKEILTVLVILVLVMIEITILRHVFNTKNKDPLNSLNASNPFGKYSVDIVRMLAFIIAFSYAVPISYTPLMMKDILSSSGKTLFDLPEAVAIAIPISAEMLATAVFSVIAGSWTHKKGWKYPFILGSFCMAAGSFIAYYINDPYAFILARTFIGTASGFALVTLQCFPMISPDVTIRNNGLAAQNSGLNAGYCCGVAIGGLCAEYMGFSGAYLISVIVAFLAMIYAFYFMKNAKTYNTGEVKKISAIDVMKYFSNRNVFLFFFAAFIPVSICSMFLTYMFPVFAESRHISAGDISRVFMMNSLIIIYLGPTIVRYLSAKEALRGKWSMVLYIGVTLSGLLLFAIHPSIMTAVVIVLLVGLGDSFGLPMSNDYLLGLKASSDIGYDNSVGYLNFIGNIGQMAGPVLMGYLFAMGYDKGTIVIIIGMTLLLLIFTIGSRTKIFKRETR